MRSFGFWTSAVGVAADLTVVVYVPVDSAGGRVADADHRLVVVMSTIWRLEMGQAVTTY